MNDTQKPTRSTTGRASKGFTDEERAAMKEHAQELKAAARRSPGAAKADGESDVRAKIAEMPEPDRVIAERLHAIIRAAAPALAPRTWYGMPAYARDGNVISSFNHILDRMWRRFGRQMRHPTGIFGSLAGWCMAIINDKPNRLAIDALAPGPNDRVLELGCGPGWALRTIAARAPGGQFFGIDQSDRMLEQAANINQAAIAAGRMQLVKGQFRPLPWIDCTFNKVLLVNVAYFFDSDGNDAAEVFRVFKPGGRLAVYVTARETMEKWPFAGPDPPGATAACRSLAHSGYVRGRRRRASAYFEQVSHERDRVAAQIWRKR